jgi:hypothetical protein
MARQIIAWPFCIFFALSLFYICDLAAQNSSYYPTYFFSNVQPLAPGQVVALSQQAGHHRPLARAILLFP